MKRTALIAVTAGLTLAGCGLGGGMFGSRDALVAAPETCVPQRFEIYFADSEARLTEAARQTIGATAAQLRDCDIQRVQVIGLADARGGGAANQGLSERRPAAVGDALKAAGWPVPVSAVEGVGDAGAVTEAGAREPMRRRTEVLVEAAPRR
ncbi:OmpA family protein [Brevundimonas sp.]|uniref:OmpA family protein n=1 Tax=Brevundimonas sp. TaxID=1871086 RepID=UPI003A90A6C0